MMNEVPTRYATKRVPQKAVEAMGKATHAAMESMDAILLFQYDESVTPPVMRKVFDEGRYGDGALAQCVWRWVQDNFRNWEDYQDEACMYMAMSYEWDCWEKPDVSITWAEYIESCKVLKQDKSGFTSYKLDYTGD